MGGPYVGGGPEGTGQKPAMGGMKKKKKLQTPGVLLVNDTLTFFLENVNARESLEAEKKRR